MRRLRGIGFGVIVVALTVGVIAGVVTAAQHIPRPEKKIAWVQREDSIIVQMKTMSPPGAGGLAEVIAERVEVPEFTLYGDGTLIEKDVTGSRGYSLYTDMLSTADIQALLKSIRDEGFFDFSYQEPSSLPSGVTKRTTYFYAATKETQNAVSADFALMASEQPANGPPHYRKLGEIRGRLYELTGHSTNAFTPNSIVLAVQRTPPISGPAAAGGFEWPFPEINLASIAPDDSSVGERRVDGTLAGEMFQRVMPAVVVQGDRRFNVGIKPVLPYEENFPEFELATP